MQKGQQGPQLLTADLLKLDGLLSRLPEDTRTPPADRGLIIQYDLGGRIVSHTYDRADMPSVAWDVLRLSKCPVSRWVLQFKQKEDLKESSYGDEGAAFALTPDQQEMLYGGQMGPLRIIDVATRRTVAEIPDQFDPISKIIFSPDSNVAVVAGGGDLTLSASIQGRGKSLPSCLPISAQIVAAIPCVIHILQRMDVISCCARIFGR
jgi:hypothetical protein